MDASGSTPAISNSSSSGSNSMALSWTAATWAMVAMLTTNSPVSRMLTKVSFSVSLSERGWMDSEIRGGLRPTQVKNEMGAMLGTPSVESVLTQAIGRGMMLPMSNL